MHRTIFVSIASYRDRKCVTTLEHLYEMARYPMRVFVGLCIQNKDGDPDCTVPMSYKNQVRVIKMSYRKAKGPTFARYLCTTLFQNEDFFMQIDSHCLFAKNWDEKIIDQWEKLLPKSRKPILSHYPPIYSDAGKNDSRVTVIRKCFFNHDGILTFHGAEYRPAPIEPTRNAFVAAGFFFSSGQLLREVPFDPLLPYLFTGEEILLSIRFFTHGFDIYSPNENIVFHDYIRKNEPKFWDDHKYDHHDIHEKVKIIMGIHSDLKKIKDEKIRNSIPSFGLGTERSLSDFYHFIGVDIQRQTVSSPIIEFYQEHPSMNIYYLWIGLYVIFFILWFVCIYLIMTKR